MLRADVVRPNVQSLTQRSTERLQRFRCEASHVLPAGWSPPAELVACGDQRDIARQESLSGIRPLVLKEPHQEVAAFDASGSKLVRLADRSLDRASGSRTEAIERVHHLKLSRGCDPL